MVCLLLGVVTTVGCGVGVGAWGGISSIRGYMAYELSDDAWAVTLQRAGLGVEQIIGYRIDSTATRNIGDMGGDDEIRVSTKPLWFGLLFGIGALCLSIRR